ncbi:small ribosomal subunit protein bS16m isoform X2 [Prorops nasuta]|uniref:small ribosomal subunit protein bS16m isoform X2 n=1 Tax=Prorops nasuta TaxID=863751 RepID=UPI0034CD8C0A
MQRLYVFLEVAVRTDLSIILFLLDFVDFQRKTDLHVMPPIEQLGSYDPIPNKFDEKLVSLNLERIHYWMGRGAALSEPLERLLGLSGFLPMHPTVFIRAWRNRRKQEQQIAQEEEAQKSTSTNNSA